MGFEQFKKLCAWVYRTVYTAHFSLDDCVKVFACISMRTRILPGKHTQSQATGRLQPSWRKCRLLMEMGELILMWKIMKC